MDTQYCDHCGLLWDPEYGDCDGCKIVKENKKMKECLAFYKDERNWTKKPDHACSAIIADTGTRAKQCLEDINNGAL